MSVFGQQNKTGFGAWFEEQQRNDEAGTGGGGGGGGGVSQGGLFGTWTE